MKLTGRFTIPGDFPGLELLGSCREPSVMVIDDLISGLIRDMGFLSPQRFCSCAAGGFANSGRMSTSRDADWRADLDASRDLSDLEKQSYGFVPGWFESWRLRKGLRAERPAAVLFWKEQLQGS